MIVPITVNLLAKTTICEEATARWLDNFGVSMSNQGTDADRLVAMAAKQCYMSFEPGMNPNVTKVRKDLTEYLTNILKSGHGSVLEHVNFTFAIDGVSRVFTGEMNRHRAGWAISERSGRFIRFGEDIPYWLPTSLQRDVSDDGDLEVLKRRTRRIFSAAFENQSAAYNQLVELWDLDASDKNFHYKKVVTSCLRRIIGMGYAGGGIWTGNVRALRHVIAIRTSDAAEEEIHFVFCQIAKLIVESEPRLFGDFEFDGSWVPAYPKV